MRHLSAALTILLLPVWLCISCGKTAPDPLTPESVAPQIESAADRMSDSRTRLWGFYDVTLDPVSQSATVNLNRCAMFSMNIVSFLNADPALLSIKINGVSSGAGYKDIDFDIGITHPIPDAPQFNGYDVRGIFIGDEGTSLFTDFCLAGYPHYPPSSHYDDYPSYSGSQEMMDDPVNGDGGGPDGYTRWFSPRYFTQPGLFGYTQGLLASDIYDDPTYYWSATLNPYKFFADGLGSHDNLIDWLDANPETTRVFSSGSTNHRNYYVRFSDTAFRFAYAVSANWEGPDIHPANMREAIACEKIYGTIHPDYNVFTFKIYDPASEVDPGSGQMLDYVVHLDEVCDYGSGGTILEGPQLVPIETGDNYCVYHVEIPSDILQLYGAYDFWVVARYPGYGYSNPFGKPNDLEDEDLAAWFCFELDYSNENWK
jgi:hypothetical protein